ncbi:MAG: hypothetical protein HY037_01885 [Nitrospirae bacterium]|nr:hypothetical protein [Candidatus Troglogloeales bacterium]
MAYTQWISIGGLIFIVACAPVSTHYAFVEQRIAAHDGVGADAVIEKKEGGYGKNSRLLYLLDRGMTLSLSGQYEKSNQMLDQAAQTADALYTESLTLHGAALLTNDNVLPYSGEDFERVMIHLISALNYAQQGELSEALVECRRVDTKLNSINDRYQDKKNGYKEDAFARYLSGILYEAQGEINDAFIAYRKGFEVYREWAATYGTPIPPMIGADLLRTTDALHLREEHEEYEKVFSTTKWTKVVDQKGQGELIIVSLNGRSPRKENLFFDIVIDKNIFNSLVSTAIWQSHVGSGNIPISTIGQLVRIALPEYISQKSDVGHLSVGVTGPVSFVSNSALTEDITAIAQHNLEDRINRIRIKAIARAALKALAVKRVSDRAEENVGGIGGLLLGKVAEATAATTEVADLRSWRTLPDEIHLTRMVVPPGVYQVTSQFISRQGERAIDSLSPQQVSMK